jgi:hypothetical protein
MAMPMDDMNFLVDCPRSRPGGHNVEIAAEDGRVGFADNSVNFPDIEDDENARDAELTPTHRGSVESTANVVDADATA